MRITGCSDLFRLLFAGTGLALSFLIPGPAGAENSRAEGATAEILLRKSFTDGGGAGVPDPASTDTAPRPSGAPSGSADTGGDGGITAIGRGVSALGERLVTSGTLHLPGVPPSVGIIDMARNPVVELENGRRLILDPGGRVDAVGAAAVASRWPSFQIVPLAGGGLQERMGILLEASGYASVVAGSALTFGSTASVQIRPDYVVLRSEDDLLRGRTLAVSVVDTTRGAVPAELRELALAQGILVTDLLPDGSAAGPAGAPWRDPHGRVTTVQGESAGLVLVELASVLGLEVDYRPGESGGMEKRWIVGTGEAATRVFIRPPPAGLAARLQREGGDFIVASDGDGIRSALGHLFERFAIPAIGPVVEFTRPDPSTGENPFLISIPGWLVDTDRGRLLVTGAAPPAGLRLFLTREGIDLFEYRVH